MDKFKVVSKFKPTGDQPKAIETITQGIKNGKQFQTLMGITGSGKTYTMAKVIENINRPTLVISHNKTLAAQLCAEFREFFPNNSVGYFVSYYDYYQPEAYIPSSDTYIEKETNINEEIDKLRHQATAHLLSRKDCIIVASVSAIYGLGSPFDYLEQSVKVKIKETSPLTLVLHKLAAIQYDRNQTTLERGQFRVSGGTLEIFPTYAEHIIRISFFGDEVERIQYIEPLTRKVIEEIKEETIFPAKHFVAPIDRFKDALKLIHDEMEKQVKVFTKQGKLLEAQRIRQRTEFDIEMIQQTGYCNGIENYSRFFGGRKAGDPPFSLMDYFKYSDPDFLIMIDESHMTVPQIGAMYNGDRARKNNLIDFGFRLPSAYDNRPLKFNEFEERINQSVFVSATPGPYEFDKSTNGKVTNYLDLYKRHQKGESVDGTIEQVIRPTGILDPIVEIHPVKNQIDDAVNEIQKTIAIGQRVLVTTLTKRMAEELSEYLGELSIKACYLHSEVDTLERLDILKDLRKGVYDVVVGINLLREGLDLPEVSTVLILDGDNEGFLRSATALIQTIGRAARHIEGRAVIYADKITNSIRQAKDETERRRKIQIEYNEKHGITPASIKKKIKSAFDEIRREAKTKPISLKDIPENDLYHVLSGLEEQMKLYAESLQFEKAADMRDQIKSLKEELAKKKLKGRF
ncbi:excinuclease ABC subunit UvrB [bacterium]|nr:excinuclease ABC subunit UvrB [bacterium]